MVTYSNTPGLSCPFISMFAQKCESQSTKCLYDQEPRIQIPSEKNLVYGVPRE